MIVAFSTSSPVASVALLRPDGSVLAAGRREAPRAASGACLALLQELQADLSKATLFLADLGPGSFTGVRVGVTLAQTFAFVYGVPAGGTTSFDLIDRSRLVAVPFKANEAFVRPPGQEPYRSTQPPAEAIGYGPWFASPTYPDAAKFDLTQIVGGEPERLLPSYQAAPSISIPKPRGLARG